VGKTIQVTSAQVNAARLWIERADREGTGVPDAIRKLAQARPRPLISDPPIIAESPDTTAAAAAAGSQSKPDHDALHCPHGH
jgi:hypothetical protein